ncbi:MAG: DUF4332 domain-containing protein [Anaerolineae bacterium]|nr:DUF4332 domain-containing protein [Anaerolineae bacterium]
MSDTYGLDLSTVSLADFRRGIEAGDLLPSYRILRDDLAARFATLETAGLHTVADLVAVLSTKQRVTQFAAQTGLPEEYVTLLRRKARSYLPRPIPLKDLPGVAAEHAERLAAFGIKQTEQLWQRARTAADRADLAAASGVPPAVILDLARLADVARAGYVGPIFARLLVDAGADSLATLAGSDAEALYARTVAVNAAQGLTKAGYTAKDIALSIDFARRLPHVAEFP